MAVGVGCHRSYGTASGLAALSDTPVREVAPRIVVRTPLPASCRSDPAARACLRWLRGTRAYPHLGTNRNPHADEHAHPDAGPNANTYAHADGYPDANPHGHADSDADRHSDPCAHSHVDRYCDSHSATNPHAYRNPDACAHCDADARADRNAHPCAGAVRVCSCQGLPVRPRVQRALHLGGRGEVRGDARPHLLGGCGPA